MIVLFRAIVSGGHWVTTSFFISPEVDPLLSLLSLTLFHRLLYQFPSSWLTIKPKQSEISQLWLLVLQYTARPTLKKKCRGMTINCTSGWGSTSRTLEDTFIAYYLKGGARGVMVIVVGNGHGDTSSNPGRDIAFHIALISLGKVWIQLFSLQLWVNSRADWDLQPWWGN